jgi:hypothetical protein
MKTRQTKKRKGKTCEVSETSQVCIIRDLMKSIYVFGRPARGELVDDLTRARECVRDNQNFYVRVDNVVYHANITFYNSCQIPEEQILSRLDRLMAAPKGEQA